MRPVNLIPVDQRRGAHGPARTGPLAYVVLGVLVAALAGVTSFVLTGNTVAERKAEVIRLEQEEQATRARAESLRPFAEFAAMQQARVETVSSLAQSRFDWERVLRELALVIPDDVWLSSLTGKARPDAVVGGAEVGFDEDISGPSLAIEGCAAGHEGVARFVAALEDIDGVTRVGLASSELSSGVESSTEISSESDCQTRNFISKFAIVAAFDDALLAESATQAPQTAEPISLTEDG